MTSMPFHARLLDWVTAEAPEGTSALLGSTWLVGLLLFLASVCLVVQRALSAATSGGSTTSELAFT